MHMEMENNCYFSIQKHTFPENKVNPCKNQKYLKKKTSEKT